MQINANRRTSDRDKAHYKTVYTHLTMTSDELAFSVIFKLTLGDEDVYV